MLGHNARVQRGRYFWTQDIQDVIISVNIKLAALHIRSGRVGGLEADLKVLRQGNDDMGILQDTKLTDRIRARQGEGYSVWAKESESRHQGRNR